MTGSFNLAALAVCGAMVQPVKCFFDFCQGKGIFPTSEVSGLEALKTMAADFKKVFHEDAVLASFGNRAFLETDVRKNSLRMLGGNDSANAVLVVRATSAWFVKDVNFGETVLPFRKYEHDFSFWLKVIQAWFRES